MANKVRRIRGLPPNYSLDCATDKTVLLHLGISFGCIGFAMDKGIDRRYLLHIILSLYDLMKITRAHHSFGEHFRSFQCWHQD